jgi:GNAT superfamily N-acetyltransferase
MMSEVVVREAEPFETKAIAGLRWQWVVERGGMPVVTREEFVASVLAFAAEHERTHHRVVAVRGGKLIGMGWLAVLPRVPSPRSTDRTSGDVQCVYVLPEERNAEVGSKLMEAILHKARQLNLEHVTVHSSAEAIRLYERNGFTVSPRLLFADFAGY